jgi:hypothetical protein
VDALSVGYIMADIDVEAVLEQLNDTEKIALLSGI